MQNNRYFYDNETYILPYNSWEDYTLTAGYNYIPLAENLFMYEGSVVWIYEDHDGQVAIVNGSATEQSDFTFIDCSEQFYLYDLQAGYKYKFLMQLEYIDGIYSSFIHFHIISCQLF